MTFKELECIRVICEKRSISKAADSLYMTPQGLSKMVRNIENELEAELFVRTAGGITLTAAGEYLYDRIPELLTSYKGICRDIRLLGKAERRELELLSAYGIIRLVTPDCLIAFQQEHPEIHFHYQEFPDRQVEERFDLGEGNVAFSTRDPEQKSIHAQYMESFEIKLLVHKDNPLSRKKMVSLKDIKDQPVYIESDQFNIHHMFIKECRRAGFEPKIVFASSGFSLCHKMVAQNRGVSPVVDFVFDDMGSGDTMLLPFEEGPFYWDAYMLTRNDVAQTREIRLFYEHVMNWMSGIKAGKIKR